MSEPTPDTFGEYHLLEKIATGGMAEVWRARAYGLAGFEKILVIKKVLPALLDDEDFIRLFIDEARIAVQLRHANIVQVFDLGEVDGQYFMAMEYVQGYDLSRLVQLARGRGPIPVELALFSVCEVLKALVFAHDRTDDDGNALSIVHCDISPQNILVSLAGEVKLTDFGISKAAFQSKKGQSVVRGKYAYMSPEQVSGKVLDRRSDLFSLGIVLFELLTGRRLFKGSDREDTMERVRRAEVPRLRTYRPEISERLERTVLKALRVGTDTRYQTAQEMLEEIAGLMVADGYRATNHDLAAWVRNRVDSHAAETDHGSALEPTGVVVLCAEAFPPPRTLAAPTTTLASLMQEWAGIVSESGGQVWERQAGSVLVCWRSSELQDTVQAAVEATLQLKLVTTKLGFRLSAGLAPGVARVDSVSERPGEGWELAGPFYLARWMMNLSAHRGRPLLTEVGAKQVQAGKTSLLGRISILGNQYINLYEVN